LQPLDDVARERVRDDGGIDAEIQAESDPAVPPSAEVPR